MSRVVRFRVEYCDPYLGYTLDSWPREVRYILEDEYAVKILVEEPRRRLSCGELDPKLYMEDELILEGLPGEEGYLIEVLKHHLDRLLGVEDHQ